jgi:dUTP pyrophosphatase
MSVKIILLDDAESNLLPTKATVGSAGIDLRARLDKNLILLHNTGAQIGTGIRLRVEPGFCALILPRSGLGSPPHYVTIPNAPGLVDPDYEGEVFVNLFCLGTKIIIAPGDRIAQLLCLETALVQGHYSVLLKQRIGGAGSTGAN